MLQKAGGTFTLTSEVDFGAAFGLKSLYYKTRTSNIADAGQFRLARADVISWRNQANGANLDLGVSSSNVLQFNGIDVQPQIAVGDTDTIDLTFSASTITGDIKSDCITNAMINSAAGIAFSKLATLTSGNILVGSAGNVVTSVTMSGDATIIASGALTIANNAVTNAKLAEMATLTIKGNNTGGTTEALDLTATQVTAMLDDFVGDSGSGGTKGLVPAPAAGDTAAGKFLKADGTWEAPSGSGDVVGPASATDNGFVRFDGTTGKLIKNSPASITNADVVASAAIAVNKLAALTASRAVVSDGSGFLAAATTTATEIGYVNGVTSAIQTQINTKQTRSTLTTKGDLYVATASDTVTRLGVGSNGQFLMADSTQSNGVQYITISNPYQLTNYSLELSVDSNALTIALKDAGGSDASATSPIYLGFRSDTLANGTYTQRSVTGSLSIVVPSGATLGLNSGSNGYIYVYALDNAGTVEIAVSSVWRDESELGTTSSIDTSSDTSGFFSTTGRASKAFRLIGRLKYITCPNGAYSAAPDACSLVTVGAESLKLTESISSSSGLGNYVITAGQYGDLTSIVLQPGVWDVSAMAVYFSNGAVTTTSISAGFSTNSGNDATGLSTGVNLSVAQKGTGSGTYNPLAVIPQAVTTTSTTTYYLKALAVTSITNLQVGYNISARRIL